MSYMSTAQRGYFNANRDKLEAQGVNVDEWNSASKGLRLPKHSAPAGTDRGNWERGKTSYKAMLGRRKRRGIS